jgi:hypothetical protein
MIHDEVKAQELAVQRCRRLLKLVKEQDQNLAQKMMEVKPIKVPSDFENQTFKDHFTTSIPAVESVVRFAKQE